jgi:hypothetical protein
MKAPAGKSPFASAAHARWDEIDLGDAGHGFSYPAPRPAHVPGRLTLLSTYNITVGRQRANVSFAKMTMPLPPADDDAIIRLHDYYFQQTDLIYGHVEKLYSLHEKNGRLSHKNTVNLQSYAKLWLATLYVVVEGFQSEEVKNHFHNSGIDLTDEGDLEMKVYWDSIQHKIEQLGNQLKSYRNVTFHFQPSHTRLLMKRSSFLQYEGRHRPIEWARELQEEMRKFFSQYRPRASALLMHQEFLAEASEREKPVEV